MDKGRGNSGQRLPPILLIFPAVLIFAWVTNIVSTWIAVHVLHLGAPYNLILLPYRAVDFLAYLNLYPRLHSLAFFGSDVAPMYRYPAPVMLIYAFFYGLPHSRAAFLAAIVLTFVAGGLLVARAMMRRGIQGWAACAYVAVSGAFAYPIYFEYRQANTEVFLFLLIAGSVWAIVRGKDDLAGVLLGVAGAMKLFPFLFLAILIQRKRYRAVAISVVTALLLTVVSLRFLTPSIVFSWHGVGKGLADYNLEFQRIVPLAFGYDHSIFTVVKLAGSAVRGFFVHIRTVLNVYLLCAAVAGATLWLFRVRRMPLINQVFVLVLAELFLPPSSFDYTLIHLFVPWTMLVLVVLEARGQKIAGVVATLCLLALICGFETEFIVHGLRVSGSLKALLGLALFAVVLRYPMPCRFMDDGPERLLAGRDGQGVGYTQNVKQAPVKVDE